MQRIGPGNISEAQPTLPAGPRNIAIAAVLACFLAIPLVMAADSAKPVDRPNVVFICVDGWSSGLSGFEGHPVVKTPKLDKLAGESARFTRAYVTMPQAAGSRVSMLTGQYPHVHGVINDNAAMSDRSITFSEVFKKAGYACGLVGAWKLPQPEPDKLAGAPGTNSPAPPRPVASPPGPMPHGTNLNPIAAAMNPPQPPPLPARGGPANAPGIAGRPGISPPSASPPPPAGAPPKPLTKPGLGFDAYYAISDPISPLENAQVCLNGESRTADRYLPDWQTDRAIDFVRASKDKPFCLCLFFPPVRSPLSYPPGTQSLYPPASLPVSQPKPLDLKNLPGRLSNCEPAQNFNRFTGDALRESQSKYYAMLTRIDENVGRLMEVLEELHLKRNTVVVFASDQGFATGENRLWGTGPILWERFIRCPLLIRLPSGKDAASSPATTSANQNGKHANNIGAVVSFVDIAPTLLDIAGLVPPPMMQGRSLLQLLRTGADPDRPVECFVEYDSLNGQPFPARAIIADPYKLVDSMQDPDQFYNLKKDANEEQNLADEPAYSSVVKVMRSRLDRWRKHTHDSTMR